MSDTMTTIKTVLELEDDIEHRLTLVERSDQPDTLTLILDDDDPHGRVVTFRLTFQSASELARVLDKQFFQGT